VYAHPWDADRVEVRELAAILSLGRPAWLSHLTALRRWAMREGDVAPVHASVPSTRCIRGTENLIVHRSTGIPRLVNLGGVATTARALTLAQSWPLLAGPDQRGPTIRAVRNRLVTPGDLGDAAAPLVRLPGRREFLRLVDQLDAGCESELEIWGFTDVFDVAGLRHARRQLVVAAAGHRYRLDLAYEAEKVAVELDGAASHSSPVQRERDRRRDAELAGAGWLTLRYGTRRLHEDVAGCRRDTLAALAARRPTGRRHGSVGPPRT
jgi:very-short-patch-repair endonuclease